MLRESNLLNQLAAAMPPGNGVIYFLYGDSAYPQFPYLIGGYRHPAEGSPQAVFNLGMSRVWEAVEWGFKEIATQ